MSPVSKLKKIFAPHSLREVLFSIVSPFITLVQFVLLVLLWPIVFALEIVFVVVCLVHRLFRAAMVYVLLKLRIKYAKFRGALAWPVVEEECPDCSTCKNNGSCDKQQPKKAGIFQVPLEPTASSRKVITTEELYNRMQKEG